MEQREKLNQLYGAYLRALSTPGGQKVLEDLEDQFLNRDLVADKPHLTHINVGAHRVVVAIRQRMKAGQKDG